ncbi:hypothetical protein GCM10010988_25730 [Cnuibacter physcomitrellae]|uniref:Uncharacterized protein n=1 Tax=Cnuibacter physcomitrellae TaxID=1619308 RepID=A0A1X9LHB5_9MICO|nr:hypothetical protein [Cnuibacter physcomitrellae]ARJ03902.1 hypothetical protein B5808_00620 [Cnuibacter physcomitrellae]GGI39770.1 hypothetical protein GCM10010988_25730 [Cnuibacter physcomitrellae]
MSEVRFVVVGDAALFAAIAPIGAERFAGAAPERVVVEADVTGMRLRSPGGEVSFGLPWRVVRSAAADGPDRLALAVVSPSLGTVTVPMTLAHEAGPSAGPAPTTGLGDAIDAAAALTALRRRGLGGDVTTEQARAAVATLGVPAVPPAALRFLVWLLLIPLGAGIGFAVALFPRLHGSLVPIIIGAALGTVFGVVAVIMKWQAAKRLAIVGALRPGAMLVHALRVAESDEAVRVLGGVDPAVIGGSFVLALDGEGVHVFRGKEDAQLVVSVAWPDVLGVSETFVTIQRKSYSGLSLRIRTPHEPVELGFGISGRGLNPARGRSIEELRDRILSSRAAAAGTAASSGRSAPSQSYVTPPRRAMLPGMPSTAWARVLRVTSSLTVVPVIAVIGLQTVRLTAGDSVLVGLPLISVVVVVIAVILVNFVVLLAYGRRQKAETAAGYTLSRTGDIGLDQLDPTTGYVIRPAGAEQLTRDGERSALARVRALAS